MTARKGILRVGRDVLLIVLITVALGEVSLGFIILSIRCPSFMTSPDNRFRGKPFAHFI